MAVSLGQKLWMRLVNLNKNGGNPVKATAEEIKKHDEDYSLRNKYWHVLAYIDHETEYEASERAYWDDMTVVRERLKPYDLTSMCDMTTSPNHNCTCSGAGIRLRRTDSGE